MKKILETQDYIKSKNQEVYRGVLICILPVKIRLSSFVTHATSKSIYLDHKFCTTILSIVSCNIGIISVILICIIIIIMDSTTIV